MPKTEEQKFKLDGEHKQFVINKLAMHCGQTEIVEAIKKEYDVVISVQGIDYYKKKYETEWREQRAYFNLNIAEIEPFADKANRVKARGDLIRDIEEKGLWYTVFGKFGDYDKGNHGAINDLLDSIHKELEPFKIAPTDPSGNLSLIDLIKKANETNGNE